MGGGKREGGCCWWRLAIEEAGGGTGRRTGKNVWTEAQMAVWGRRKETHPAGTWGVAGVTDGGRIQQGLCSPQESSFSRDTKQPWRALGVGLLAWFEPLELRDGGGRGRGWEQRQGDLLET